jgi:hypothetical protein
MCAGRTAAQDQETCALLQKMQHGPNSRTATIEQLAAMDGTSSSLLRCRSPLHEGGMSKQEDRLEKIAGDWRTCGTWKNSGALLAHPRCMG